MNPIHYEEAYFEVNDQAHSIIIPTESIADLEIIVKNLLFKGHVLVLSDLDLTLIRPLSHTGSPLLFDWTLRKTMQVKQLSKGEAITFLSPLNKWLDSQAKSTPVEGEATRQTISSLQTKVAFMGCTARRAEVSANIFKQLEIAEIAFTQDSVEIPLVTIGERVDAAYKNGILFTGSSLSKGEVLKKYLKETGSVEKYTHIILIDDLKDNLSHMATHVNELGISFIGLHYKAFKEKPLSDDEAIESLIPYIEDPKLGFSEKFAYLIQQDSIQVIG